MTAFFCYERNFSGEWSPVVYYEEPQKSSQGTEKERSTLHKISGKAFLGNDLVSPNFSKLVKKFPKEG